ncbi:MAG: choice-of-anchor D domain-containing protein [Alphaproteobacteria bacterium]|nr:choice-of-anchor D domain-containing protein [Alphaproteobacteria bacterium]
MRHSLLVAALCVAGCNDYDIKSIEEDVEPDARIEVTPVDISFGGVRSGETVVEVIEIESVGTTTLNLRELDLNGTGAFTLLNELDGTALEPGAFAELEVAYSPLSPEDSGYVTIHSNALNLPEAVVTLNGGGLLPQLTVDPEEVDFGFVSVNDSHTEIVRLINSGGEVLEIELVATDGAPFDAWAATPLVLDPGQEAEMEVTFSPTDIGSYLGEAWISSNAPGPDRIVPLRATSEERPVAICSATPNPVSVFYQRANFIGEDSYDPAGLILTDYDWRLVSRPSGSAANMPSGQTSRPNRNGFQTDMVGTYIAELVVTNELGVSSEPCLVELDAEPSQDLWVEMYWVHSGDDMDLHLLKPGGQLTTMGDCYYGNCTGRGLDWGQSGVSSDNPTLDIDDIPGTGPENINIASPETGTFTVYVHDYPGSTYQASNDVTVNIYLGGVLVWTDTRAISGENNYVPFAEIVWPDQIVNGL